MVNIMVKLFCGVGINDAGYCVKPVLGKSRIYCPFYDRWADMMKRCYSKSYQIKRPTYDGSSVCNEWHLFSNFKAWMEMKDWKGKDLDKDILIFGNKIYSPETCVFVDKLTNSFITDNAASRGLHPIGVHVHKKSGRFRSRCRNPFKRKLESLGMFDSPEQAHLAWRRRKHQLACQLAELQPEERVAQALRLRYA